MEMSGCRDSMENTKYFSHHFYSSRFLILQHSPIFCHFKYEQGVSLKNFGSRLPRYMINLVWLSFGNDSVPFCQ